MFKRTILYYIQQSYKLYKNNLYRMPFYAVHKGKRRGIYTDWAECKQNIFGVKHPIFKKFNTKEEAEHFLIHGFGTKTNQSMMDTLGIGGAGKTRDDTDARDNSKINNTEMHNIDIDGKNTCYVKNCTVCKTRISFKIHNKRFE